MSNLEGCRSQLQSFPIPLSRPCLGWLNPIDTTGSREVWNDFYLIQFLLREGCDELEKRIREDRDIGDSGRRFGDKDLHRTNLGLFVSL